MSNRTPVFDMLGHKWYWQRMSEDRLIPLGPNKWRLRLLDGDYYSASDLANGRCRIEARCESPMTLGEWNTLVMEREIQPDTYALWGIGDGSDQPHKQCGWQVFNGKQSKPMIMDRLENTLHEVFGNSYADGPDAGSDRDVYRHPHPFAWGKRRIVLSMRPHANGTMDSRVWYDGVLVSALDGHTYFTPGQMDDIHWKAGLYIDMLANPGGKPPHEVVLEFIAQHAGLATDEDLVGGSVVPPAPVEPAPQPQTQPVPVTPAPAPAPAPGPVTPPVVDSGNTEAAILCAALEGIAVLVDGLTPLTAEFFPKEDDDVARVAKDARKAAALIRARVG